MFVLMLVLRSLEVVFYLHPLPIGGAVDPCYMLLPEQGVIYKVSATGPTPPKLEHGRFQDPRRRLHLLCRNLSF